MELLKGIDGFIEGEKRYYSKGVVTEREVDRAFLFGSGVFSAESYVKLEEGKYVVGERSSVDVNVIDSMVY